MTKTTATPIYDRLVDELGDPLEDLEDQTGCEALLFGGTLIDPPEYCENMVEVGSDYCEEHRGHDLQGYEDMMIERADAERKGDDPYENWSE